MYLCVPCLKCWLLCVCFFFFLCVVLFSVIRVRLLAVTLPSCQGAPTNATSEGCSLVSDIFKLCGSDDKARPVWSVCFVCQSTKISFYWMIWFSHNTRLMMSVRLCRKLSLVPIRKNSLGVISVTVQRPLSTALNHTNSLIFSWPENLLSQHKVR